MPEDLKKCDWCGTLVERWTLTDCCQCDKSICEPCMEREPDNDHPCEDPCGYGDS